MKFSTVRPADLVLRTQLAVLRADAAQVAHIKRIRDTAAAGEHRQRAHRGQADGADPGGSDRRVLAGRDALDAGDGAPPAARSGQAHPSRARKPLFADFEDEIGESADAPVGAGAVGTDMACFNGKARQFLDAHRDHITLQKVRRAEQLTRQDLDELERMFLCEGLADENRLGALRAEGGLGVFVRSLLGLDRQAAKQAFSSVLDLGSMSANQIHFINLILDYLTERGEIDRALLYDSPFTDIHDRGLGGVFSELDRGKILSTLDRLNAAAAT